MHPSGVTYSWGWRDGGRRTSAIPAGMLDTLPPAPDEPLPVSERHDGLLHPAGSLLARRVYEPDLLAGALLEANRVRCRPPKGEREVRALALWATTSEVAIAGASPAAAPRARPRPATGHSRASATAADSARAPRRVEPVRQTGAAPCSPSRSTISPAAARPAPARRPWTLLPTG